MPLPHPEIFAAFGPGVQLLLDDGKMRLEVEESGADSANTRVVTAALVRAQGRQRAGAVLPVSP